MGEGGIFPLTSATLRKESFYLYNFQKIMESKRRSEYGKAYTHTHTHTHTRVLIQGVSRL